MDKPDKYQQAKEEITSIFHEHQGRYGYRRATLELKNRGYHINHKTVQRLMEALDLKCMARIKKHRSYRGQTGRTAPNLTNRDFHAEAQIKNGRRMLQKYNCGEKKYTCPLFWICIMAKSSATT